MDDELRKLERMSAMDPSLYEKLIQARLRVGIVPVVLSPVEIFVKNVEGWQEKYKGLRDKDLIYIADRLLSSAPTGMMGEAVLYAYRELTCIQVRTSRKSWYWRKHYGGRVRCLRIHQAAHELFEHLSNFSLAR